MRRFTPGFVVRNGGLLLPVEAGVEVYGSLETSPEIGGGGGGVGASSPAISAIASIGGPTYRARLGSHPTSPPARNPTPRRRPTS